MQWKETQQKKTAYAWVKDGEKLVKTSEAKRAHMHATSTRRTTHTHTHTHIHLTALFPGLPGSAGTRKAKPIWILLKQETVSGSGIIWAICKSAPSSRKITTPAPHHSIFLQAGCPSCHPINSVKALKATREGLH